MSSFRPRTLDLDLTILSAKHLKNVNWRNGDLVPYVVFWINPDRRVSTKPDEHGSTKPNWNEHFILPIPTPLSESSLTLQVVQSKPVCPKSVIGSLRFPLRTLSLNSPISIRTLDLFRPSGRPHGKIRVKIALIQPDTSYPYFNPYPSYYPHTCSNPYPSHYMHMPGYSGPSAPVDYDCSGYGYEYEYDRMQKGPGNVGVGPSCLVGSFGGLGLAEEKKVGESSVGSREEYRNYRADF